MGMGDNEVCVKAWRYGYGCIKTWRCGYGGMGGGGGAMKVASSHGGVGMVVWRTMKAAWCKDVCTSGTHHLSEGEEGSLSFITDLP